VIGRLSGLLAVKTLEQVIVDVAGVGYELSVPATTLAQLPPVGERCVLVVHTHLREDGITLFGFTSEADREAFRLLQTVSGVGPRLALGILSGLAVPELADSVAHKNLGRLRAIPGVGPKTAERICLELRDKVAPLAAAAGGTVAPPPAGAAPTTDLAAQVVAALVHMGYRPAEAERAARSARERLGEGASTEALLRDSLVRLVG
jgi:Holliday junction DNA helicase RuvA